MKLKKEKGQAVVEFALVLPVLILLIFGMLDFGWMFYNKIAVNNAAREGARYGAIHYQEGNVVDGIEAQVSISGASLNGPPVLSGDSVKVSVIKTVPVLTGIGSMFLNDPQELTADCTMKKE